LLIDLIFMQKSILASILVFLAFSTFAQTEELKRVPVEGKIIDTKNQPVINAHILNKGRNEGWVTDLNGRFQSSGFPGDTLEISAISYHPVKFFIPDSFREPVHNTEIIMLPDTVQLREIAIHPWPATLSKLKQEFMKVEVEDPADEIDLHLPSMADIKAMNRTPGEPGQIGLYSGSSPISLLYNQFSREAKSRKLYSEVLKREKAEKRYNRSVVARVTGLKNDEEILKFMEFCALQVKFILESSDYELYAAILNCYEDYCQAGFQPSGSK
jgi:predicted CopG family antitoxin